MLLYVCESVLPSNRQIWLVDGHLFQTQNTKKHICFTVILLFFYQPSSLTLVRLCLLHLLTGHGYAIDCTYSIDSVAFSHVYTTQEQKSFAIPVHIGLSTTTDV